MVRRRIRALAAILGLLGSLGCASFEVIEPKTGQTLVQGRFASRGCLAITHTAEGTDVVIQQAARSNWGSIGGLLGIAELAASIFGGSGQPELEDEGDMGCAGLFSDPETVAPTRFELVPVE